MATDGLHDHPLIAALVTNEQTRATAAEQALSARIAALEGATPPPPPPPPPPTGNVAEFPNAGGTQAAFLALVNDQSLDGIVMRGGTKSGWGTNLNVVRSKPLLVTPYPGETVVFSGGSGALFLPGWDGGHCTGIAFRGPGFEITGRTIGASGILHLGYAEHMEFSGFKVRSCTGSGPHGMTSHVIYCSTGVLPGGGTAVGPPGVDLTFNDWDVSLGTDRSLSFLQLYHAPQVKGLVALRNKVDNCHWGFVGRHDATNIAIADWTITNCDISFDSQGPAGTVKRMKATSSGAPVISLPMVAGLGADANVWA